MATRAVVLWQALALCLLCIATVRASADVQADEAHPELTKCQFSKKELHTAVRSAAVSALTGICDPVEMEARLLGMEQRLKHRMEELKQTLVKLFIDGVAYDYEEEGGGELEQHRYTGGASSGSTTQRTDCISKHTESASKTVVGSSSQTADSASGGAGRNSYSGHAAGGTDDATRSQHGDIEAHNRVKIAGDTHRTWTRTEVERRAMLRTGAVSSAGTETATEAQTDGTDNADNTEARQAGGVGISHGYRHRWNASQSQRSSEDSSRADVSAREAAASAGHSSSTHTDRRKDQSGGATVTAGGDAATAGGVQIQGSRRSSSWSRSHRWGSSSAGSSEEQSEGQTERTGYDASRRGTESSQDVTEPGVEETGQYDGSSSHRYSHERRTSAQDARAIGGASDSERRESQGSGANMVHESRRHLYERNSTTAISSGAATGEDRHEARAIGAASQSGTRVTSQGSSGGESRAIGSADFDSRYSAGSRSSSRHRSSQQRSGSSRGSSGDSGETPYVDFGPGGPPEQQSWFPGTSRTTVGTGVPDLSVTSSSRTGGFGFGAVGEPLDESSGRSYGAQVRAGGSQVGDGEVLFRDGQRYANSAEARRPGSVAGGDSSQYATLNASWGSSGERQVNNFDASSASRPEGTEVSFLPSYRSTQGGGGYTAYVGQRSRDSNWHRSRQSFRSREARRRAMQRRRQHATDTVSSITGAESAPLSRYTEIETYNNTVYLVDGKQRFAYYWEINDFPTMMETWENHHSLRSPSFYVYRGGYRMYIRVFPSRQGGNVYLHTGLTKGEYDDQLVWPFQLRLRLSLLDHSSLQHDIRSRIWDPRRLCSRWNWQRPRHQDDNFECVGLGFPQSLLETQRFLLDGAVLLKLEVFIED